MVILSEPLSESGPPPQILSSEADRQALLHVVLLRTTAKDQIGRDVIAGRLSLVQAAALFGALNRIPPQPQSTSWRFRFPADTEEERLCRQILQCLSNELAEESDRREATIARLEGDFKEDLRTRGAEGAELTRGLSTRMFNWLTLRPSGRKASS